MKSIRNILKSMYYGILYCIVFKKPILTLLFGKKLLRSNQLLIFDAKNSLLHRCALNADGYQNIVSNYAYLERKQNTSLPRAVYLQKKYSYVMSGETLLKGGHIAVSMVTDAILREAVNLLDYNKERTETNFDAEKELGSYDQILSKYPENWAAIVREIRTVIVDSIKRNALSVINKRAVKTLIHGDLTYRNMLISGMQIQICDFCRSGIDYPEYDIYLFALDKKTYIEKNINFHSFFKNIIAYTKNDIILPEINNLYDLVPGFKQNMGVEKTLRYIFLYRMIVLTLECFKQDDSFAIKTLNEIKGELGT